MTFKNPILLLAMFAPLAACQPDDNVKPKDDINPVTLTNPAVIFHLQAEGGDRFIDASLSQSNNVTAVYTKVDGMYTPLAEGGQLPAWAGADADLLAGVGFGTYPNPEQRDGGDGDFAATLHSELTLENVGDSVKFCRSFATTCVTVSLGDGGGNVWVDLAANVPDTEIGEITNGVSAAIRGTGDQGLTIAVTDPSQVSFDANISAGKAFTLTWTTARGSNEGSLQWDVAIDGKSVGKGQTDENLMAAITKDFGVGLGFRAPLGLGGDYDLDYSYTYNGITGDFGDTFGVGVEMSPQANLGYAPLYVYPTVDPGYELLTLTDETGMPHAVQPRDGVVGTITTRPGEEEMQWVWSTAFNGDDFDGIPGLAGNVDYATSGGGFYASPTFCYANIVPAVIDGTKAGVRDAVRVSMYQGILEAVVGVDVLGDPNCDASNACLDDVAAFLRSQGESTPYTIPTVNDLIAIGEDYANNNVDAAIATKTTDIYAVTITSTQAGRFATELGAIVAALSGTNGAAYQTALGFTAQDVTDLGLVAAAFQGGYGVKNGVDGVKDDITQGICDGYDCNVDVISSDIINGTDFSGQNPAGDGIPGLAATCLWGAPSSPEVPASAANFSDDFDFTNDFPSFAKEDKSPKVDPVRETAVMNDLVAGVYGNYYDAVFGKAVPASNFSMSMTVGDTSAAKGPGVSMLTVARTPEAATSPGGF